jgi:hypothetical protein
LATQAGSRKGNIICIPSVLRVGLQLNLKYPLLPGYNVDQAL